MTALLPRTGREVLRPTDEAEAAAVEALRRRHAELSGLLAVYLAALDEAAAAPASSGFLPARTAASGFCGGDVRAQITAEERSLYPAAASIARLAPLVDALVDEHRVLEELLEDLRSAGEPRRAAAIGRMLRALFDGHVATEDERVLPEIAADPLISLADILTAMPDYRPSDPRRGSAHG